jgi:hypothetical protein
MLADLDPPPHGLIRLRARVLRVRRRQALWAGLVLGPAAATAAIVALIVQTSASPALRFDHPALVEHHGVEVVVAGQRMRALEIADGVWLVP